MAHIYILKEKARIRDEIIELLVKDDRLDQICWTEEPGGYKVLKGGTGQELCFTRGGPYKDLYNHSWDFQGDLSIVDGRVEGNTLSFELYPDAFTRIASLLDSQHCGDLVLSAKLGCEFNGETMPLHPGRGSHGSLHREDSVVPLIVSGTDPQFENPRIVDFVPFILRYFGVPIPDYLEQ